MSSFICSFHEVLTGYHLLVPLVISCILSLIYLLQEMMLIILARSSLQGVRKWGVKRPEGAQHKALEDTSTLQCVAPRHKRDKELKWWNVGSKEKLVYPISGALAGTSPLSWEVFGTGSVSLSLIFQVVILGTFMVSTMHIRRTKPMCLFSVAIMHSILST